MNREGVSCACCTHCDTHGHSRAHRERERRARWVELVGRKAGSETEHVTSISIHTECHKGHVMWPQCSSRYYGDVGVDGGHGDGVSTHRQCLTTVLTLVISRSGGALMRAVTAALCITFIDEDELYRQAAWFCLLLFRGEGNGGEGREEVRCGVWCVCSALCACVVEWRPVRHSSRGFPVSARHQRQALSITGRQQWCGAGRVSAAAVH